MSNKKNIKHLAAAALAAGFAGSASAAAVIAVSPTAPTVDGGDIANLANPTGSESIWSDRPIQGQTFTSGSTGGTLNAITVRLSEGDGEILGWKDYQLRLGTIDMGTNTINPSVVTVERYTPDADSNDYFTFTLDTPIALTASTLYGFDIGIEGSQEGWQAGIPAIRTTGDEYAGGQRYSGSKPNQIDNTTGLPNNVNLASGDLVFHLDIETESAVIPSPTAALAGVVGLGGLALRRRRNG